MNYIRVAIGEELFRFETYQQWVNKGRSWFANCGIPGRDTMCVDAAGRVCRVGRDFMQAQREETFPVVVYSLVRATNQESATESKEEKPCR